MPSFNLPFGTTPLPPELQQKKGRYWNYEKNRWSFCSDDSDNEEPSKIKTKIEKTDIFPLDIKTIKTEQKDTCNPEPKTKTEYKDIFVPLTKVNLESQVTQPVVPDTKKERQEVIMTNLDISVAKYPQVQAAKIMKPEEPVLIVPNILPARYHILF